MKSLITLSFFGLITCFNVKASNDTVNVMFSLSSAGGDHYEIVATDGEKGILKLQLGQYHCYGEFELDKSHGGRDDLGHINIYFPSMGQRDYPGNCHNFSLSVDLLGKKLWQLAPGEELQTHYRGVESFNRLKEVVLTRLKRKI